MEQGLSDRLSRAEHAMLIELLRKVAGRRSGGFNRSAADHNRLDPRARVMVKIEKAGWVYPK